MFEQSILIDHAHAKRTRAVAVSFTVQCLAVAMLLILPLMYSDRLPDVHLIPVFVLPPQPLPPPPEPVQKAQTSQPVRANSNAPRLFRIPTAVPTQHASSEIALPALAADDAALPGLPIGFGPISPGLPPVVAAAPVSVAPPVAHRPDTPSRVGGDVQAAKLIRKVVPAYPVLAKQARVSGVVHLMGIIAKDGTIQRLEVINGPGLLVQAALQAVRQWVYKPTLLNGEAVEVMAPIDVIFTLQQ